MVKSSNKGGLDKWFSENWVDISRPKKSGGYAPCGRKKAGSSKGYPKCLPASKASKLSSSERASAVSRKRKVESKSVVSSKGRKPNYVSTKVGK